MLKWMLLVDDDDDDLKESIDGLKILSGKYGLGWVYKENMKLLKDFMETLDPDEQVFLVSDTRIYMAHIITDFLAAQSRNTLMAKLSAFLLYTKDEYARESHEELDPRIHDLQPIYVGRYHRSQPELILAAVAKRLEDLLGPVS